MCRPTETAGTCHVVVDAALFVLEFFTTVVSANIHWRITYDEEAGAILAEVDAGAVGSPCARRLARLDGDRLRVALTGDHVTMRDGHPRVQAAVIAVDI